MKTRNEIFIRADAARVYAFASDTAAWPTRLPHYRYVRVMRTRGPERTLEMGATRSGIPVAWTAIQRDDPTTPEIRFTHIRGWTRGMEVVWRFLPEPGGTRVVIEHELVFRFPVAARFVGERIIGEFFVHFIAGLTLARMRELSEA